MKKIIVLTDFSKSARNAADAALEIASMSSCNILLVNSFFLPFVIFSAEAEGRSLVDSVLIASASESNLKKEARRLRRGIVAKSELPFKPTVEYLATIESINQTIKDLNESTQTSMILMGVHRSSLPIIFSAIDLEPLLNEISCPLLIIPKNHKSTPIHDLVFAVDLKDDNLAVLKQILNFAKTFNFKTHVCHVSKPVFTPDFIAEDQLAKFKRRVSLVGQHSVTFTNLKAKNVANALNEFNQTIGADMLGIVYNPHSFTYKLFNGTHTSQLIKSQKLPLLIFPSHL
jgi:nucleotide-binding universal stress UspA family protein